MFTRGFLLGLRCKAVRRNVLFRALDEVERGILYLSARVVEKISNPTLTLELSKIVTKLQEAMMSGFQRHLLCYGAKRLVQVVKQALCFGSEAASSWTMDKGFMSYLTALDFNQPPGFRGVDGP